MEEKKRERREITGAHVLLWWLFAYLDFENGREKDRERREIFGTNVLLWCLVAYLELTVYSNNPQHIKF